MSIDIKNSFLSSLGPLGSLESSSYRWTKTAGSSEPSLGCPADINNDGVVDVTDLLELINQWGQAGGPADIDGDGIVGVSDLLELINSWGTCSDTIYPYKLLASDGEDYDYFGWSVATSGNTVIVGAPYDFLNRGAYVYRFDGTDWIETKLTASDGTVWIHENFGTSVAVYGDTVVIGAPGDSELGGLSGSAYVYRFVGTEWHETKLTASDGASEDRFGSSVAVSGDYVVVGAWGDDDNGSYTGSAYIYYFGGTSYTGTKLTASDGAQGDSFGHSVAISGDYVVVGAWGGDDNGNSSGSAYVYSLVNGFWQETSKLTASDGAEGDKFGWSVAVDGDTVVVGAYGDDDDGSSSGSAYIYKLGTGEARSSGGDFDSWKTAWKLAKTKSAQAAEIVYQEMIKRFFGTSSCKLLNSGCIYQPYLKDDTSYLYIRPSDSPTNDTSNLLNNFSISGDPMIVTMKYGGFELEGFVSLLAHVSPNGNCVDEDGNALEYIIKPFSILDSYIPDKYSSFNELAHGFSDNAMAFSRKPLTRSKLLSGAGSCTADINNDGVVDVTDLLEIISQWGQSGGSADINNDGIVDVSDLLEMIDQWGPCRQTDDWVEQKISPSDGEQGDKFGSSLVLGDNTLIVGSPNVGVDGSQGVGAVYVYRHETDIGWVQSQKIMGEQSNPFDFQSFGSALDLQEADHTLVLSEDRLIIGAINDQGCGSDSGAAYIYKKSTNQWIKEQKLTAWDCGNGSWPHLFSSSVAIFDSYAFVGARGDNDQGIATGAVYVFKWNGSSWSQHQKLTASEGTEYDWFGTSLSASRDELIVGAKFDDRHPSGTPLVDKGGAYVFKLDEDGNWQEHDPQLEVLDGEENDGFGSSVAIHENLMIVSASSTHNDNGTRGAVYIFKEQEDGSWDQLYKLMPGDEGVNDGYFGSSIDVLGESLLVGTSASYQEEIGPGSLYLFERVSNTEWVQVNRFVASDGINSDWFGTPVSLESKWYRGRCAVGAKYDDTYIGSVYVYERGGRIPPYRDDFDSWKYAYDLATEKNSQAANIILQEMHNRFYFNTEDLVAHYTSSVVVEFSDPSAISYGESQFDFIDSELTNDSNKGIITYNPNGFNYGGRRNDSINLSVNVNDPIRVMNTSSQMLPISQGALSVSGIKKESITERGIEPKCPADINNDGVVDVFDLLEVIGQWGPCDGCTADINNDGVVDVSDLLELLGSLGPCGGGGAWSEQEIGASDAEAWDLFGTSVFTDGQKLIIGAPGSNQEPNPPFPDEDMSGSAYIFRLEGNKWVQEAKLIASDISGWEDKFGLGVSIYGDTAFVGAYGNNNHTGAVYVFEFDGIQWNEKQKIVPSDAAIEDFFGFSFAVEGDTIIIGSSGDDDGGSRVGSAYVFKFNGLLEIWEQKQKIIPSDGAEYDFFGSSISISGDRALIGSFHTSGDNLYTGAAYFFSFDGTQWNEKQKVSATNPVEGMRFGWSVSISGNTALIGAYGDNGNMSGSAYFYEFNGKEWNFKQKVTSPSPFQNGLFGWSVSISERMAIIGQWNVGSKAFVFKWDTDVFPASWVSFMELEADSPDNPRFGECVCINGNTILVGASDDAINGSSSYSGSAYVYELYSDERSMPSEYRKDFGSWKAAWITMQSKDTTAAGIILQEMNDRFDLNTKNLSVPNTSCPADINNDGVVDVNDLLEVIQSWGDKGGPADIDHDGIVGVNDLLELINSWGPCPSGDDYPYKLLARDGASEDRFGWSVSISGDGTTAIVGAIWDDDNGTNSGSAYVYRFDGTDWIETKLLASDGASDDHFGISVSISSDGTTAIVGASGDDDNGFSHAGSVYVFRYDGSNWGTDSGVIGIRNENQKLIASDGDYGQFGRSVSISGDGTTAIVGAYRDNDNGQNSGSVYIYSTVDSDDFPPGVWQETKLLASDGVYGDHFGSSVSISGDGTTVIVGAYWSKFGNSGSAYIYSLIDGVWQETKLTASDGAVGDWFGGSVSISSDGTTVIVGAHLADNNTLPDAGAAYIFRRTSSNGDFTWKQQAKLTASEVMPEDYFGWSVSISDDTVVIGTPQNDDNVALSGSAYVFRRNGDVWTQTVRLLPSDGEGGERFGCSVSISSDGITTIVGARYDRDNGFQSGSAYIYLTAGETYARSGGYMRDDLASWKTAWELAKTKSAYASEIILQEIIKRFGAVGDLSSSSDGFIDQAEHLYLDYFNGSVRINGSPTSTLALIKGRKYKIHLPEKYSSLILSKDGSFDSNLTDYYYYEESNIDEDVIIRIDSSKIYENVLYLKIHNLNKVIKIKMISSELLDTHSNLSSKYVNHLTAYNFNLSESLLWKFKNKNNIFITTNQKSSLSRQNNKGNNYAYSMFGISQPDLYLANGDKYNFIPYSDGYPIQFTSNISGGKIDEYSFGNSIESKYGNDISIGSEDSIFAHNLNGSNHILAPRFIKVGKNLEVKIKLKVFFDNTNSILLKWDSEHALFYGKQTDAIDRGAIRIPNKYDPNLPESQRHKNAFIQEISVKLNRGHIGKEFDIRIQAEGATVLNDRIRVKVGKPYGDNILVEVKKHSGVDHYHFSINSVIKPELKLIRGSSYTFNQNHRSNSSDGNSGSAHPLYFTLSKSKISEGGTPMKKGVSVNGSLGKNRSVKLTLLESNSFSNMYYSCELHGLSMGNKIHIYDPIEENSDSYWTPSLRKRFNIPNHVFDNGKIVSIIPSEDNESYMYYQNVYDKYLGGKINFSSSKHGFDMSKLQSQEGLNPSEYIDLRIDTPGKYIVYNNDFYTSNHYFIVNVNEEEKKETSDLHRLIYDQYLDYQYPFDLRFASKEAESAYNDISLSINAEPINNSTNYRFIRGMIDSLGPRFLYNCGFKVSDIPQISSLGLGSSMSSINYHKNYTTNDDGMVSNLDTDKNLILNWDVWDTQSNYLDEEKLSRVYSGQTSDYINYLNKIRRSHIDITSSVDFGILKKLYDNDALRVVSKMKNDLSKSLSLNSLSFCGIINIEIGLEVDIDDVANNIRNNKHALDFSDKIILDITDFNSGSITDSSYIKFINSLDNLIATIEQAIGRKVDTIQFDLNNIISKGKYTAIDISSLILKLRSYDISEYIFKINSTDENYYGTFFRFINDLRIRMLQTYVSAQYGGRKGLELLVDCKSTFIDIPDSRELRIIEFYSNSSPRPNKLSNWWLSDNGVNILNNKMNVLTKSGVERIFLKYPLGFSGDSNLKFDQLSDLEGSKASEFLSVTAQVSSASKAIEIGMFVGISDLMKYYSDYDGWDAIELRNYMFDVCKAYSDGGIKAIAIKFYMNKDSNIKFIEEAFELFRSIIMEHSIRVYFYGFYLNPSKMFGDILLNHPCIIDANDIKRHYSGLKVDIKNAEWHILGTVTSDSRASDVSRDQVAPAKPAVSAPLITSQAASPPQASPTPQATPPAYVSPPVASPPVAPPPPAASPPPPPPPPMTPPPPPPPPSPSGY